MLCFCLCIAETLYCQETDNLKHIRDALQNGEYEKVLLYCKTDSLNFPMSKYAYDREKLKQQALDSIAKINSKLLIAEEAEKKQREARKKEALVKKAIDYNNKGTEQMSLNNYGRAIDYFNEAIILNPSGDNYYDRARAKIKKGDYYGAIDDANEAIKRNKSSSKYEMLLGDAFCGLGKFQDAIDNYEKALSYCNPMPDTTSLAGRVGFFLSDRSSLELKIKWAKEKRCF